MDALAALVTLLNPRTVGAKIIHGRGRWGVRYRRFGQPSFALVLRGSCWLAPEGLRATTLAAGDFVLFPATPGFTLASDPKAKPRAVEPDATDGLGEVFHGSGPGEPDVSLLGGFFAFDPINAALLVDLLPGRLHIRAGDPAIERLTPLATLIRREVAESRPGRVLVLGRLIEVLLVEALRSTPAEFRVGGLLAGLQDPPLAAALRGMHTQPAHRWTLVTLARQAGMSRSAFAERFARVIGTTPLNYLRQWRIALAKSLLARKARSVAETAEAIGYESASGFSTAFSRETGQSPRAFAESVPELAGA